MKRLVWIVAVVLAMGVAYAMAYRLAQPAGTPSGQIRAAILDAVDAMQNGQTGRAMRVVSSDYKDSTGTNRDRLFFLARQAVQNRAYWSAVVEDLDIHHQGDTATVRMALTVHRTEGGGASRHKVNLRMRREPAHAYLIVPTTRWRVVSADNLPLNEDSLGF